MKILQFCDSFLLSTLIFPSLLVVFCLETDTITSSLSLKHPHTIVSQRNIFKLGFFTPENTTNQYLGIYYTFSEETIVWVANRNNPITDSSGTLTISRDGNLVLLNGQNQTLWSTNTTSPSLNTIAQILDSGNLVLRDVSSGRILWESFMHPTHVFLPTMKGMNDSGTTKKVILSSWKNNSDPAVGSFVQGMEFRKIPEIFTWNVNGQPYWRSGAWNGRTLLGLLSDLNSLATTGISVGTDESGVSYVTILPGPVFFRIYLDPVGKIFISLWNDQTKSWIEGLFQPDNECDVYGKCGPFGSCNRQNSPICSCLKGFEPRDKDEWGKGNWTGGCVRRKQLECGQGNKTDGFFTLRFMKLPDFPQQFTPQQEDECRTRCLENCSCIAHAYDTNIGCMFWSGSLIDVQQFPGVGPDLHIRLASSELGHSKGVKLIVIIPVIVASVIGAIVVLLGLIWVQKRRGRVNEEDVIAVEHTHHSSDSDGFIVIDESSILPTEGLPLFTFETLANATNEFHDENLLGKGGFGPVYKGILVNGKAIAVKRLSTASGQGTKEFMNEVMVISKLQHTNLVRLIGYCVEKEEKMLVYEYMPNKSLDSCLFGRNQSSPGILDWRKRYHIMEGVARGLLYLHKDSRLKIIHRDLKPSNVLLDEDWSPKISDFGMAKIFGGNQDHLNTSRVVGTYGYMSPEYATEGRFSEKSDVYSFGVLMLEIMSGKKSTHYYNQELSLSLLGWAWKLWNDKNSLAFVDQALMTSSNLGYEITRCIQVALLCVQEFPEDRPDIQTIISMLSREIVKLPMPEKPVFAEKWNRFNVLSTQSTGKMEPSINELTLSVLDGR